MTTIWIVSYYDVSDGPITVTAFDNREAAQKMYEHERSRHDRVDIDEAPVCHGYFVGKA